MNQKEKEKNKQKKTILKLTFKFSELIKLIGQGLFEKCIICSWNISVIRILLIDTLKVN